MKRSLPTILVASVVAVGAVFLSCRRAPTPDAPTKGLRLVQTIALDGVRGRIDHMAVDLKGRRLFAAALGNGTVEEIDLRAGRHLRSIKGLSEPQGVAYVPRSNRLFVANGGSGMCDIYDGVSFRKVGSTRLGDDADNVRYDAAHGRILVGYGNGGLSIVNVADGKVAGSIPLSGHPESFQLDSTGNRAFVNIPNAGEVAVVDLSSRRVSATWAVTGASSNFPMALDGTHHRLFVGCRRPARLLVFDTETGQETMHLSIGGDTDDIFFDPSRKRLYVCCGAGMVDVFQQDGADRYSPLGDAATASGARTSLFVPVDNRLYVAVPQRDGRNAEIRVYETQQ